MKVITDQPWQHKTGNLLDPNHINENLEYTVDVIDDVFSRRYSRSIVVYPFEAAVNGGYTDGYTAEDRSYRITAMDTLWIEHAYLDGYVVGSASISITDVDTGSAPTGVTNPIVTAPTTDGTDTFVNSICIPRGKTYKFQLTGASFTVGRLDLIVHYRTDRFNTHDEDTRQVPDPNFFTEADSLDANSFNDNIREVSDAISYNAAQIRCLKPMLFVAHNFLSTTDADLLTFTLPLSYVGNRRCKIVAVDAYAVLRSAGTVSKTLTWTITDASAATIGLVVLDLGGRTLAQVNTEVWETRLQSSTEGASGDSSLDYTLKVSTNDPAAQVLKSYIYLYVE